MRAPRPFTFRLYVAGDSPNSAQAVQNLRALCEEHLPGRHEVEIVDILRHPERALADGVLLTPLLVKLTPKPLRKIFGNLSQRDPVLRALGLGLSSP